MVPSETTESLEEAIGWWDETRVPDDRLEDDAGDPLPILREEALHPLQIIEGGSQSQASEGLRHTRRVGESEGRDPTPRLDEKAVAMAVIAARELDDEVTARSTARDADGCQQRPRY